MHLILAIEESSGRIGQDGKLPFNIPEDRAFFRKHTTGHTLIMGNTTYETVKRLPSFQDGSRTSWVLTRHHKHEELRAPCSSTRFFQGMDELQEEIQKSDNSFVVIGGAEVARQFLELGWIDSALITWVGSSGSSSASSVGSVGSVMLNPEWFETEFKRVELAVPLQVRGDLQFHTIFYERR